MLARRHRTAALLLTLLLVALVAGTASSTVFAIRAARELDRAVAAGAQATAVLDFLKNDLLAQAGPSMQGKIRPDITPEPNMKVRTLLDRAAERIEGKFQGQPLVEATIRETIGTAYTGVDSFDKAEQNLKRAFDLRLREQGEKAPETLSVMNQLFWLYQEQMDNRKAEPLGRMALDLSRNALGEDHPITLDVMGNLAWLYMQTGKDLEAEPLAIKYLETCRRVFGEEHLETAVAYNTMGYLCMNQARYADDEKNIGCVSRNPSPHPGQRPSHDTGPQVSSRKDVSCPRQECTGRARVERDLADLSPHSWRRKSSNAPYRDPIGSRVWP